MRLILSHTYTEVEASIEEQEFLSEQLRYYTRRGSPGTLLSEHGDQFLTGLVPMVRRVCSDKGHEVDVVNDYILSPDDLPEETDIREVCDNFSPREYQVNSARFAISRRRGILNIATGGGKTEIAAMITKFLQKKTLFLVDKIGLLQQTYDRLLKRGIAGEDLGVLGDQGAPEGDVKYLVSTAQSVNSLLKGRNKWIKKFLQECEVLIMDEAHHASGDSWVKIGGMCENASYRFGLSGSPFRSFNKMMYYDRVLIGLLGEEIINIPSYWLRQKGWLAQLEVHLVPVRNGISSLGFYEKDWRSVYRKGVVNNSNLNGLACKFAYDYYFHGRKVLIFCKEIEHGKNLIKTLYDTYGMKVAFSSGQGKYVVYDGENFVEGKKSVSDIYQDMYEKEAFILVGSSVYQEGIDMPFIDTILNLSGGRSVISSIQVPGRGSRNAEGKDKCLYVDFVPKYNIVLINQAKHRRRVYESEGFDIIDHDNNNE